jgi:2-polyprenyl-3-methyl-5-hydroxy-6-metoxy-1,4-benzoquinol methylase
MQLYVDGLSPDTSEKDLVPLFAGVGSVESVKVIRDIVTGHSKGFALIKILDDTQAQAAIGRLNGTTLAGRKLVVFRVHDILPGEMEFREWLRDNAGEVISRVGVEESHTVVDYGCGPGIFSLAAARAVGQSGRVHALDIRPRALERLNALAAKNGLANIGTMLIDKAVPTWSCCTTSCRRYRTRAG